MTRLAIIFAAAPLMAMFMLGNLFRESKVVERLSDTSQNSLMNIVTILLFAQIRGDVLHNQNLGYALALGMIGITGLSNAAYIWLRARSERWLR